VSYFRGLLLCLPGLFSFSFLFSLIAVNPLAVAGWIQWISAYNKGKAREEKNMQE
jgi:hypothetical protein